MTTSPVPLKRGALRFAKGHGTENDFVLIPDLDGSCELSATDVRRLCDRRAGIGADGLIRIAPSGNPNAPWFMDYRNADGSIAQMCGNGVRVVARYLATLGLSADAVTDVGPVDYVDVDTRSGIKRATFCDTSLISVDMGRPVVLGSSTVRVRTATDSIELSGLGISMGNPHLACELRSVPLERLDLNYEPDFDAALFADGVNIEFFHHVEPLTGFDRHVQMRVHERGVGETRSCGTGICAVAVAALGECTSGSVVVDVPGGRLFTDVNPDRVILRGPAVIVANGVTSVLRDEP
ncbi:MAG: diaminopimelate epimerase [Antricoccus sp.]